MIDLLPALDPRDLIYTVVGLAFFGLTLQPALAHVRLLNLPLFYVLFGACFGGITLVHIDPLQGGWQSAVIEHASELVVIISLAGAGLAVDRVASWRSWNATWRRLGITMPLTVAAVGLLAWGWLGLTIPGALLLAAALAPAGLVLARSVQVSPPCTGESDMEVAPTAEAGLSDGLPSPFVYLAIYAVTLGMGEVVQGEAWLWSSLTLDLAYRVAAGHAGRHRDGVRVLEAGLLTGGRRGAGGVECGAGDPVGDADLLRCDGGGGWIRLSRGVLRGAGRAVQHAGHRARGL
ncbi:cation:proton antiporter [Jannaschia seohaensis]|uniref:cation:proton antiporter n=1 Tax=Jannaschia seohaensis TaxID=475081 RepID=UPI000D6C29EF|nr:cation:proton antiporter [Jannaschia seohaensis]